MAHIAREREDGLMEYVVRPRRAGRTTTIPLRLTAATESTALARSAERGATPPDDKPAGGDGPAGRKGRGKDKHDDQGDDDDPVGTLAWS